MNTYVTLTANGFSPGGSGTTIRHNTQITHITQNNTTIKRNTEHKTTHTINTLNRMKIEQSQLELYIYYIFKRYYPIMLLKVTILPVYSNTMLG
jgi:hypothetical protein